LLTDSGTGTTWAIRHGRGRWHRSTLQLHLAEIAHHLRPARMAALEDQPFSDKARPKDSDGKRDRQQSMSGDFCDWHRRSSG
jgi:hypothetical protein